MGSFRRILTASLVEKRRTCCRAGLPCCTVRRQGMTAMGTQGCSSEQGPFAPGGCVLGQGLCCLPGSALSLPRRSAQHCREEIRTALQGEAVGRRSNPRQGRARSLCCREGAAWVRAAHSSTSSSALFKADIKAGVTSKERCLPFEFSPLGWLSGQRDISRGTF